MKFDFEAFSKLAADVYRACETWYSLSDVLAVFRYFFESYEEKFGEAHPRIRKDQIQRIIETMPVLDTDGLTGGLDSIFPDDYPVLIDAYFQTWFWDCDYRINHFFSGKVRSLRFFETLY